MARVNEGSQFYLPPTHLPVPTPPCLYSSAAAHHRTLAGILISRPTFVFDIATFVLKRDVKLELTPVPQRVGG